MPKRLIGVLLATLLLVGLGVLGGPAFAVEGSEGEPTEEGPPPNIDDIGTQTGVAREFFPEPYEKPTFTWFLLGPLIALALIATIVLMFRYLALQPRFAEERRARRQRRGR